MVPQGLLQHWPYTHDWPGGQVTPQPPQFVLSKPRTLMQAPLQYVVPPLHWHEPRPVKMFATHAVLGGQTMPHPPQLFGSPLRS